MNVTKKDGTHEGWDWDKIEVAIHKAAQRANATYSEYDIGKIRGYIESIVYSNYAEVPTEKLHAIVIEALCKYAPKIGESYKEFRDYKNTYAKAFEAVKNEADTVLLLGDKENANFDSSLVSTKGSLIKGYLTKQLYKQFYLTKDEKEATKVGKYYIHDMRDMLMGSVNCFSRETTFLTSEGIRSFKDFNNGDQIKVLTHKGNWKTATVHSYGKQPLYKVSVRRSRGEPVEVFVTKNHRWLLRDNKQTTALQVGDVLTDTPDISSEFSWESLTPVEKALWCLGFVFGDGSQAHASACTVRLCGDKNKYAGRFKECGYTVTVPSNKGWGGDSFVWLHDTAKMLPPKGWRTVKDTQAFINGLLCADGGKDPRSLQRSFRDIQISANEETQKELYDMLNVAGYYVSAVHEVPKETNYGTRKLPTKRYCLYQGARERTSWRVVSIEDVNRVEEVWCLQVEDDRSFLLECGIPTGNCCLFDIGNVLKGGFSMSNVTYTEPTSVLSALQVIGDITLVATAQQFGGFTIPQIDKTLLPYAKKTYDHAFKKYFDQCNMEFDEACAMAVQDLKRELAQGFQSLELKLNTVPCSRGDFAFTTLTFGEWSNDLPEYDKEFLEVICETILDTRMKGHGGKQVVFPKLVYLYDWEQHGSDEHANVFEKAVECSSKCMYPDFLAINAPHGTVSETYRASNKQCVIHPMGCRAYLTPWKDPETNEYVSVGRCNIGAVSLNLPLIYKASKGNFWEELMVNLEQIREFLKRRYNMIKHAKASTNPMAFCQGGFYKGFLKPEDEVGELTQYMTASFGISALNEFAILFTGGKDLQTPEGQKAAKDVVKFIYDAVQKFKKEDGYLYALYGTPAESLCGTQMAQYHEYCAKNNLKDEFEGRAYFTNSFHIHVSADITPFEKQDLEFELFHLIEGGHIQYVRIDNPENKLALINTILRGMARGFYQGVNFDAAYCEDCHQHSFNVGNTCPYCGSSNLSVISRVCGYLGYSNINGNSRMNDAKMAEINDRKSM